MNSPRLIGATRRKSGVARQHKPGRPLTPASSEAPPVMRMALLRDVLIPHPRILFVGINPSLRSAQVGHHFATPGNPFWRLLHAARITPVALRCEEDYRLTEFGLALTNVCARGTRSASDLRPEEIERGMRVLGAKVRRLRPAVVAFVGVSIYRRFFSKPRGAGAGPKPEMIFGARVFALPNPSGLNASFPGFRDKLLWFEQLREFAGEGVQQDPC